MDSDEYIELHGEHLQTPVDPIREPWHAELDRLPELVPTDHDVAWEGHGQDGERVEIVIPVEHSVDQQGNKVKKLAVTAGIIAAFAAVGVTAYRKGLLGPRARKAKG